MTTRRVLVTGVTGQDGRYLARLAHEHGYEVFGTSRGGTAPAEPFPLTVICCDLRNQDELNRIVANVAPFAIFNFAAFSTGAGMFDESLAIGDINGLAVTRLLEAIRQVDPAIRFCQASSSEMYGLHAPVPQNEDTPFHPRSPYGAAKLYAHSMIDVYRRRYGLHASSAILFNHESPLRSPAFVTRKITRAAARISRGLQDDLVLGDLSSRRDWGFAGDHVRAMWLMAHADSADDYVVATGAQHSVADFCARAFGHLGLDWRRFVREDRAAFRPHAELQFVGDPTRIHAALGWRPSTSFDDLVLMMVDADLADASLHNDTPNQGNQDVPTR